MAETAKQPAGAQESNRLAVLDGWRALSILAVIAGHWLPLDFVVPGSNGTAAAFGMALFFTLSGFLITGFMIKRPEPKAFMIRRVLRILPLAWAAMMALYIAAIWQGDLADANVRLMANLGFYANLPPAKLFPGGEHLWSLCVEMQFYVLVALLVWGLGSRGLYLLPLLAIAVTVARVIAGETISIVTWHRLDEILAGAILALIYHGRLGNAPILLLRKLPILPVMSLALVCTYFLKDPIAYARPYAVALMVGVSLYRLPQWMETILSSAPARYIAQISYALYVFHMMFTATWLGSGDTLEKYLKRPLLGAVTWAAAHVSTFYYEQRFTDLARKWTRGTAPAPLRTY